MASPEIFLAFLITLASVQAINSVEFSVTNNAGNTAGGVRFDLEIGTSYAEQTLKSATDFVWKIFQQETDTDDRKSVQSIRLFIDAEYDGVSYTFGGDICIAAKHIAEFSGDLKNEISGIIYPEVAHVWQWSGNSEAPGGLIDGVAEFVRLKSGFVSGEWPGAGEGERWDEGGGVTARFLEYLEGLGSGFVAEINRKMRNGYREDYFVELMAATAGELWADYKAEYAPIINTN
ncbi:uncharacterized protein LOC111017401 [Momordica charantia]|uniref:Uncharacterized protein LOC111017401 n=1 Tax=Momordica charantia TaxID=3673 RepID=A0A6J1D651_MOMCH|nr:uncharacterized protein LOC111017401 [Momordica charantia]